MFIHWSRLGADECEKNAKDAQNLEVQSYMLMPEASQKAACKPSAPVRIPDEVYNYPNIHTRIGYGSVDSCAIDKNNELFYNKERLTHSRCRQQLFTRVFQAVPNLVPGEPDMVQESEVTQGLSSTMLECNGLVAKKELSEKQHDVFIPLLDCYKNTVQNPVHIVEPWKRGGEITRDYVKNEDYLKTCGLPNFAKRG